MKRLFLVEIDTTEAVADIGDDESMKAFLKEVVADGLGPAFLHEAPVRVLTPSGGETRGSDPGNHWLRFPE